MSWSATTTPASYKVRASNLVPDSANKIHDDDVAQRFGFSGALVPGVDLFAYVTHPLVEAWGTAFLTSGRVEVRFRRPVYDGDEIEVITEPDEAGGFRLRMIVGDDERAVGRAWPPGENNKVRRDYPTTPAPGRLLPTGPNPLPRRPLGDGEEPVSLERHDAYVQGIGETLPIYREEGVTHPGALLRIVNELLVRHIDPPARAATSGSPRTCSCAPSPSGRGSPRRAAATSSTCPPCRRPCVPAASSPSASSATT